MSECAEEIAELRQEFLNERRRVDSIQKQLLELMGKTNEWQLGIERAIGRIEGTVAAAEAKRHEK